jgi:hypothetical protein
MRGYLSPTEQVDFLGALLTVARDRPGVHLLVKPHPAHREGMLEAMLQAAALPNVSLVPRDDLPHQALVACDLLISKYSTLVLEAMVMDRPSICAILDGERQFACYENGAAYVWSAAELGELLLKLIDDDGVWDDWRRKMAGQMCAYLALHAGPEENALDTIVQAVETRLAPVVPAKEHCAVVPMEGSQSR